MVENQPILIRGASIIDGVHHTVIHRRHILIENGRICRIWTGNVEKPTGMRVIEAGDKFVIPGLIDCHAHVFPDCFKLFLSHGITGVRDMASVSEWTIEQRKNIEDAKVLGPRIFTHGELIDGPTSRRKGELHTICVSSKDEITGVVNRLSQKGVDAIKLYSELPLDIFIQGARSAHDAGLSVSAHVGHSRRVTVKQAVEAGADSIEHTATFLPDMYHPGALAEIMVTSKTSKNQLRGFIAWAKVDLRNSSVRDLINIFTEKQVYHTPTLVNIETLLEGENSLRDGERDLLNQLPGKIREEWQKFAAPKYNEQWDNEECTIARQGFENIKQLTGLMFKAGVRLGVGSDAPNPWTIPGTGLLREMELLVECGISPMDVIQLATKRAAENLGERFSNTGAIAEGNIADLVILDQNPAENISNCRKIAYVIKQGKMIVDRGDN